MKVVSLENLKESPEQVAGWFGRARRFLIEVRSELARVTWPTRREVWATTIVVIITATIFGLYLFGVDMLLTQLVSWIFGRFGG
jgi:preprotein translocase subunit SecE